MEHLGWNHTNRIVLDKVSPIFYTKNKIKYDDNYFSSWLMDERKFKLNRAENFSKTKSNFFLNLYLFWKFPSFCFRMKPLSINGNAQEISTGTFRFRWALHSIFVLTFSNLNDDKTWNYQLITYDNKLMAAFHWKIISRNFKC